MRYKKQIVSIMTIAILLLLMMSTAIQAVSLVSSISNFSAAMNGSQMKLTWSSVSNSAGYNVYVNGTKIGSVNSSEASLIGFSENTTYRLRVTAYDSNRMEIATSEEIRFTTTPQKTLAQVQNLKVTQVNGYVTLNWSGVSNANKYQVFVDVPGFGNMNIGEVTTTNAILKGFTHGLRYGFSIRACQSVNADNTNYGERSVAQYIVIDYNKDDTSNNNNNTQAKPDKVNNVNVYDVTETTATVTWKELNNVDGYDVLLSKNYGSYQTVISKNGNRTVLSNLTPDSSYRVKVVAYKWIDNKKVYGDESSYSSFTTKKEKIVVGDISDIDVYDISEKNATVSWSKANNADGYEISLSKNSGRYETIKDTANRVVTLGNLDSDSTYRVKIVAYKWVNGKKQYGNESSAYRFNTKTEKVTVGNVRTIYIDSLTKNRAEISWSSVSGATGYNIYFAKGSGSYQYKGSTTGRSYVFANLSANTKYKVKIEAYKKVNGKEYTSENATIRSFTTSKDTSTTVKKLATVTNLKVDVRNSNQAYLTWKSISDATGYEVEISENGGAYKRIAILQTNSLELDGKILGYSKNYRVKVRAYKTYIVSPGKYDTIYGNYSSAVSFKTQNSNNNTGSNISKVTGLKATMKNTTVSLKWNKISGADGYQIDLNVPGIGHVPMNTTNSQIEIGGIVGKNYDYTARVRAYKYINGVRTFGSYSNIVSFREK